MVKLNLCIIIVINLFVEIDMPNIFVGLLNGVVMNSGS